MLGFCPLISAFDRSGKFGRSRRKDLGPSLCKDGCPLSCPNRCLGTGRWAACRSGYSLLSSGFRVKLSSGAGSSAVSVSWGKKQSAVTTTERRGSPARAAVCRSCQRGLQRVHGKKKKAPQHPGPPACVAGIF